MSVESEQLRQTLAQLHRQLDEAPRLDPEVAAQLRTTIDDIRAALEKQERADAPAETEPDDSLAGRLTEAEQYFESSHPTLATTLQRLVDILAQMGI